MNDILYAGFVRLGDITMGVWTFKTRTFRTLNICVAYINLIHGVVSISIFFFFWPSCNFILVRGVRKNWIFYYRHFFISNKENRFYSFRSNIHFVFTWSPDLNSHLWYLMKPKSRRRKNNFICFRRIKWNENKSTSIDLWKF